MRLVLNRPVFCDSDPIVEGRATAPPVQATSPSAQLRRDGRYDMIAGLLKSSAMRRFLFCFLSFCLCVACEESDSGATLDNVFDAQMLDDYELVISLSTDILDQWGLPNGDKVKAYTFRGGAHSKLKQYELAIEDLSQAIKLDPTWRLALLDRADAYQAIGLY